MSKNTYICLPEIEYVVSFPLDGIDEDFVIFGDIFDSFEPQIFNPSMPVDRSHRCDYLVQAFSECVELSKNVVLTVKIFVHRFSEIILFIFNYFLTNRSINLNMAYWLHTHLNGSISTL